jgi:hypothetical protein
MTANFPKVDLAKRTWVNLLDSDGIVRLRTSMAIVVVALAVNACTAKKPVEAAEKLPLPKTEAECIASGGQWIFAGPQNVVKYCLIFTRDAGKSCKNSSQCQSECVEKDTGNVCADTFNGCFQATGRGTVTQCVN